MSYKPKYRKNQKVLSLFLTLSAVIFTCLVVVSLTMVARDLLRSRGEQQAFRDLAALVEAQPIPTPKPAAPAAPLPEGTSGETVPETTVQAVSPYQVLYEQNPDFSAWITVPGTAIDYPVMHTPRDSDYYIYRAFDGSSSPSGTPFIGDHGDLSSEKCIIYGHNMNDGTMFHDLLEYGDKAFWEENPTFTIHTLEGERTYDIFAAVRTRVLKTDERGLRYYRLEEGVEQWLLDRTLYDTGIVPQEGEPIVILTTCSYHTDQGRFVIAGRLRQE